MSETGNNDVESSQGAALKPAENRSRGCRPGGLILGRYRAIDESDRDETGTAYRCNDETGGGNVVVKVLSPEFSSDAGVIVEIRKNLRRVSRLSHPNIAPMPNLKRDPDSGTHYLITRCADGLNLRQHRERAEGGGRESEAASHKSEISGRLPLEQALAIVRQAASALDYAHDNEVVHGNIRPENILLTPRPGDPDVRIQRFGLAQAIPAARRAAGRIDAGTTRQGQYLAPEQWRGEDADAATDQYALAVVAYELLAGRCPFESDEAAVLRQAILEKEPEPIAGLPDCVSRALRRGLAKDRKTRFARCGDLVEAMEGRRKVGRRKLALVGYGVLLPLALATGVGGYWNWKQHRQGQEQNTRVTEPQQAVDTRAPHAKEETAQTPRVPAEAAQKVPAPATAGEWKNSLGMIFVPLPDSDMLFCKWETRVQDYEMFVKDVTYRADQLIYSLGTDGWKPRGTWKNPGFEQGPTHPATGVSWEDAKAFCRWLTAKERTAKTISEHQEYRLPTDLEWSVAAGLDNEIGRTPEERSAKIEDVYPWGSVWPPPKGAGNYAGEEARNGNWPAGKGVIGGYRDGFPRTAPVGSFTPNRYGICDLGGNVWEWCEDSYEPAGQSRTRVLRGGSWSAEAPAVLLSSYRDFSPPGHRYGNVGFRIVLSVQTPRTDETSLEGEAVRKCRTVLQIAKEKLQAAQSADKNATERAEAIRTGLQAIVAFEMREAYELVGQRERDDLAGVKKALRVLSVGPATGPTPDKP